MKIGIFGGTFDPVHNGHIDLLKNFIEILSLDQVFVVPAFISPFKINTPPRASPEHRAALLKLAFQEQTKVKILTDEIERKEVSYTIDTIRKLKEEYLTDSLYLLLSEEMKPLFSKWKNFEEIEKLVSVQFGNSSFKVSSTVLREKLKKNESCDGLIPLKVLDYIGMHRLYSLEYGK